MTERAEALKNLRTVDDKIIYKLNVSVPTTSFKDEINAEAKCKSLYQELLNVYKIREDAIKNCIQTVSSSVEELRTQRDKNPDEVDFNLTKSLRAQQTTLRLMQSELMVEEVVKQRSLKRKPKDRGSEKRSRTRRRVTRREGRQQVFSERCWKAFKPPKDL